MGAEIRTEGRKRGSRGTSDLQGGYLQAQELRGGAALVVAALAARGESIVEGYSFICRGYERYRSGYFRSWRENQEGYRNDDI